MRRKITYDSQGREDKPPKMATPGTDLEKDLEEYTSTDLFHANLSQYVYYVSLFAPFLTYTIL
eukprot:3729401-Ditylum_brightwellii.AAC.1